MQYKHPNLIDPLYKGARHHSILRHKFSDGNLASRYGITLNKQSGTAEKGWTVS